MANGIGPIPERPQDYALIKEGTCVTSGDYKGCIQVDDTYYWLQRSDESPHYWQHNTGEPGPTQVLMGPEEWRQCKEDGAYKYDDDLQGWYYEGKAYRWDGQKGKYIVVTKVEVP